MNVRVKAVRIVKTGVVIETVSRRESGSLKEAKVLKDWV